MSCIHNAFRSIIVPVDGSRLAEDAIPHALAIAKRAGSKVRFVLVHPGQFPPLLIEPAKVYLRELTRRFSDQLGPNLSSVLLNGPAAPSLVEHAREIHADLLVMTTHGRGGIRRAWLGSVTDELIRMTDVPVLTVRARDDVVSQAPPAEVAEMLVPLDGSAVAEAVLGPAAALARLRNLKISLVQIVQPVFLAAEPGVPYPAGYDEQLTVLEREAAERYLLKTAERLQEEGVQVGATAVVGSATADTLLELARPERVELVAIATHGRGGVQRLLLGSVADKLVRAAAVPVLVIPPIRLGQRRVPKPQRVRAISLAEFAYA